MKKLAGLAAAATLVSLVWTGSAMAKTWVVDAANPDIECQNADFPSIQAAVAAAAPGDQIHVCPGLYPERVVVDKPDIDIYGAGPDAGNRSGADPTKESILNKRLTHFDLEAGDITIAGFTIETGGMGVLVNSGSTYDVIRQNLFLSNAEGVRLEPGAPAYTTIEQNVFERNLTALISQSKLSNVEIQANDFERNSAAAQFRALFDSEIRNNDFRGDRAGLLVQVPEQTLIDNNLFTDLEGQPITIVRALGVEVSHNEIGRGILNGIRLVASTSANIHDNHVYERIGGSGISLESRTQNVTLQANHVFANGFDGIELRSSGRNTLLSNQVEDNVRDGILIDSSSGGNTLQENLADNNLGFDCRDDSAGPGTGGTANLWDNNLGDTANRPEICKPTGKPVDTAAAQATATAQDETVFPGDCLDLTITDDDAATEEYWNNILDSGADPPWICEPQPEPNPGS